jgi:serine/threonine protein kinase
MACSIVKQLAEILKYLHSEEVSVCHRDLNHNNVMITPINKDLIHVKVKLIDFNVSRKFKSKSGNFNDENDNKTMKKLIMMTQTGAAGFCAPEMSSGQ